MGLICFVSQKGSPGTTLTALAVAASWPTENGRRKLFVEADPFGGVLALRYQLGVEPGLLTLAAGVRGGINGSEVWNHAQELPGGLPAIVGPDRPDQANAVLSATGAKLGRWLADLEGVDVICDVGRVGSNSPARDLLACADLVLMVARPVAEQLQPAAQHLTSLGLDEDRFGWVLIGERPHNRAEVEAAFSIPVIGVIGDDPRGAAALEHGASGGRLRRSLIVRSATTLAHHLAERLTPPEQLPDSPLQHAKPAELSEFARTVMAGRSNNGS